MTSKMNSWVLLLTCLLLGIWLVMPYPQATSEMNESKAKKESSQDYSVTQYRPKELNNYSAIADIPLFSPDRKPVEKLAAEPVETAVVEKTKESTQPVAEKFENPPRLVGVMLVDDTDMAFVLGEQDSEVVSLALGEKYKDWTLSKIDSTQITMTRNDSDTVIAMDWLGKEILQTEIEIETPTQNKQAQHTQEKAPLNRRNSPVRPPRDLEDRLQRQLEQTI